MHIPLLLVSEVRWIWPLSEELVTTFTNYTDFLLCLVFNYCDLLKSSLLN